MKYGRPDYQEKIQCDPSFIPEDEPVFLLRGQDRLAPHAIRHWAWLRANETPEGEAMARKAREQADAMEAWQEANSKKLPDLPETDDDYSQPLSTPPEFR